MRHRTLANRRLSIWPCLAILWCPATVAAQADFDVWTVEDGLPQGSVNDIQQTRDGYLWLATFGGLVRFDGVRFVVFDRATPGVRSLRVRALHEDRAGTLWAGTDDGMLIRYRDGRFTTFDSADGFEAGVVLRIEEDEHNTIWVTSIGRLIRYDGRRFESYAPGDFPHDVRPRDGPTAADPSAVQSAASVWWSQDATGVHCLVRGRVELCLATEHLSDSQVVGVTTDRQGAIWVHLTGAHIVRRHLGQLRHYRSDDGLPSVSTLGWLFEDRDGTLWFRQHLGVLYRIRDGTSQVVTAKNLLSLFEDREGSIWFGSPTAGLLRLRHHAISMYTREQGLSSNNVYALLRDRQNRIWVGTWGDGLNRLSDDGNETFRIGDGLPSDRITSLFEDRTGRLLVGTQAGLAVISGKRITPYPDPMQWLGGSVWAIHEGEDGTFWFGTDHGLVWQRGALYGRYTTADGLVHDGVTALLSGREAQLWVGTSRGLSRLRDGRFTSYTERDGLVGNHVRALSEDDSALWIGTYDGGLYRLADGRLTRYTTRDGMHDNGIFQILDDGRGHFWMGSNRGIARVSREDLREFAEGRLGAVRAARFGVIDGLATLECNGGRQASGLQMPDGTLWLPTQGGIAQVSPALVRANPFPPPVRIEDIRVSGTSIVPGDAGIEVPPHRNSFEADYTALSLVKSDQVRFKYRLVGLDEGWVDAGSRRTAAYHAVPPGRYSFQVIAANSDGVWNTEGHAVAIVVLAPIWRQGWFLWVLTAIAITVVVAVDRRRIGRLRREHVRQRAYARQLLDTQEQERRRISNELHDSLGQTLFMIRQRARRRDDTGADDRLAGGSLDAIAHLAGRAYEEMKEIAYNLRPYHLDKIGLTRTIDGMVRRVSGACGLEITADLENVDDLFSADAQIDVYRIVQEGVSNIVRHAAATEAAVSIRRHANDVEIEIRDNGVGIAPVDDLQGVSGPGHIGLTNLRERARALNGVVSIESRQGHGTTLRVRLSPGGPASA